MTTDVKHMEKVEKDIRSGNSRIVCTCGEFESEAFLYLGQAKQQYWKHLDEVFGDPGDDAA